MLRPTLQNKQGRRLIALGVKLGYWPCLRAPYLQLALGWWALDIWYGEPSYKTVLAS